MPVMLIALLLAIPLLELWVVVQVAGVIGLGWTLLALVATSLLGAWLIQREGQRAWHRLRVTMTRGDWPGDELTQGSMLLVGGAILLAPGFVTDVVGLLLVLPLTRRGIAAVLHRWVLPAAAEKATGIPRAERAQRGDRPGRRSRQAPPELEVEVLSVERDGDRD